MTTNKNSTAKRRTPGGARRPNATRPKSRASARNTNAQNSRSGAPQLSRPYSTSGPMGYALSDKLVSLRNYTRAVLDPFGSPAVGSPQFPVLASLKMKVIQRGTFTTSTDYVGYIAAGPVYANYSGAMYVNNTVGAADGFGSGGFLASVGHPYLFTDFGATTLKGRVIGCALRIRNITPLLNRGGTAYVFRDPDGANLVVVGNTVASVQRFASQGCWAPGDTSGGWSTVVYCKTDPADYDYYESYRPERTSNTCVGAYVTGFAGNAQTYEFEVCNIYELIGTTGAAWGVLPGAAINNDSHHLTNVADAHVARAITNHPEHQTIMGSSVANVIADGVHAMENAATIAGRVANAVEGVARVASRFKAFGLGA